MAIRVIAKIRNVQMTSLQYSSTPKLKCNYFDILRKFMVFVSWIGDVRK